MKIIIVGATGTIGQKVTENLEAEHKIIKVGSKSGDLQADITDPKSLKQLFEEVNRFDALISATGNAHFGPLKEMTTNDFKKGLQSKLLGQVNLVLTGQHFINPKGSFTLISGMLSDDPQHVHPNLRGYSLLAYDFYQSLENHHPFGLQWNDTFSRESVAPNVHHQSGFNTVRVLRCLKVGWPSYEKTEPQKPETVPEKIARKLALKEISWENTMQQLFQYYEKDGEH